MSTSRHDLFAGISAFAPVRRYESLVSQEIPERNDVLLRLNAAVSKNQYGACAISRQWYSTPEMCEPSVEALRLLLPPDCPSTDGMVNQAIDPSKWLFLDTETTGLAGGTGTYAFLIGLAWWESGGIQVEQLFMRDFDEEHSILNELANRIEERPVLVTFNGKSFDWPLLQNRFRMTRRIDVPSLAAHLDFLHPARQLWRLKIGSVRLRELEEHILGFETLGWSRGDDIDSARIPEFYFDFVRRGAVDGIAGVFRHNQLDLRGLAALAGRVFQILANAETDIEGQEPIELFGISRMLSRRGHAKKARRVCERSLNLGLPTLIARKAMHEAANLAKRDRDLGRATELWLDLAGSNNPSFEALVQLAIHYERRKGDYIEARRASHLAQSELLKAQRLGLVAPGRFDRLWKELNRRLDRLTFKVSSASTT